MTAVLREAWLWLLLAFVLGLVIGYFLRRYTVGDDPAEADQVEPAVVPSREVEGAAEPDAVDGEPDSTATEPAPAAAEEATTAPEPERDAKDVDVDVLETATVTLAELATSAPSPAESADVASDGSAPSPGSPEEELREAPHFDENVHAEHVDTGNVYMPVVEPLRVPYGRSQAAALSGASAQDGEPTADPSAQDASDPVAAVIDEAAAEAAVRDAEGDKPRRRSRRTQ